MVGGISGFSFRLAQAPGFLPVAGGVSRPVGGFRFAQTGLAQVLAGRKGSCPRPLPEGFDPERGAPDERPRPSHWRDDEVDRPTRDYPDRGGYGDGGRHDFDTGGVTFAGRTTGITDLVGSPLWWLAIHLIQQGDETQRQPDRQPSPDNGRATPDGETFDDLGNPASPDRGGSDNDGLSWGGGSDNSGLGWGSGEGGGGDFGI